MSEPDELGVSVANGSSTTTLTHLNDPVVANLDLREMESFWFPGANGTKVQGFLVKPPNFDPSRRSIRKVPHPRAVRRVLGAMLGRIAGTRSCLRRMGYVVVMVNPRGSTGYGQKFLEQVSGDWGGGLTST